MILNCIGIYEDEDTREVARLPTRLLYRQIESWFGSIDPASGRDITVVTMRSGDVHEILIPLGQFDRLMIDYFHQESARNGFFAN